MCFKCAYCVLHSQSASRTPPSTSLHVFQWLVTTNALTLGAGPLCNHCANNVISSQISFLLLILKTKKYRTPRICAMKNIWTSRYWRDGGCLFSKASFKKLRLRSVSFCALLFCSISGEDTLHGALTFLWELASNVLAVRLGASPVFWVTLAPGWIPSKNKKDVDISWHCVPYLRSRIYLRIANTTATARTPTKEYRKGCPKSVRSFFVNTRKPNEINICVNFK